MSICFVNLLEFQSRNECATSGSFRFSPTFKTRVGRSAPFYGVKLKNGVKRNDNFCWVGIFTVHVCLGFMICAMFLSMWISNTAATAMMVPIVDAIDAAINPSNELELNSKVCFPHQSHVFNINYTNIAGE